MPEGAIGENQKPATTTEDRVAGQTEIERKQSGHETEEAVAGKVAKGGGGASARARERRAVFALSTNLPYDITYVPHYGLTSIPSFSAEYYPANYGRFSFGADFECPFWAHPEDHRYLQANYLTVNGRYYFGHDYKSDYRGPYLIVGLGGVRFGIGYDEKGWQGEGVSLSAGLGYKRSIGRSRFFWEAGLSVGWLHALYDPYVWGDDTTLRYYFDYSGLPENFSKRNHALDWLGPTRAWLAIGIDLFSRKVR